MGVLHYGIAANLNMAQPFGDAIPPASLKSILSCIGNVHTD
jgi:hypothetical protein